MKLKTYITVSVTLVSLLLGSCADAIDDAPVPAGDQALALSAVSLNADVRAASNLYIMAKLNDDPSKMYIGETPIDIPMLSANPSLITFPSGKPSYPLLDRVINLYAYSGKAPNGKMTLKAGRALENDAILSNNGLRGADVVVDPANEGKGTLGSASNPASLLQFRHVMTQIIVDVKVDLSELPEPVDPAPKSIQLKMTDLVAQGQYDITAKAPDVANLASAEKATNTSGNYTLQLGTNYVVPNGQNLAGQGLTSLVIDDYTATAADLLGYTIQPQGGNTDLFLLPGLSYNLTLTVSRLKVTAIKLTPIAWKVQEINDGGVTYDPYALLLDLGAYQNTGEDQISKVVLFTDNNRTYVGEPNVTGSKIDFITLPETGTVIKTDLYTKKGLLLSKELTATAYEKDNANRLGMLELQLSVGGMSPENPSQPANESNPYMVTTAVQFLNIDKDLAGHYKQAGPLNMSSLQVETINSLGELKGSFDGNGHWFSSLNLAGSGLFSINSGTLKNMRIYLGTIDAKGTDYAGGFAGVNNGTIVGCFNEATIINSTKTVGGITGKNTATGLVIASLNTGRIPQGDVVGGLIGTNENVNAGAIAAVVNIGTLNPKASKLGGIAGTSLPSTNSIMNSCYWLIGSAERFIGSKETAVDSENVTRTDTSSRDTNELRNGISEGDTEADRIVNKLNAEVANYPIWKNVYQYVLNPTTTGSTWPVPSKK